MFAVGNAPTALFRLEKLIEEGLRPALVIAVPVGFVNVVESKEAHFFRVMKQPVFRSSLQWGAREGSNVAAAVCNALLYTAANALDPAQRGWKG